MARRTAPVSNPTWAAPETIAAGVVVARSDVYAMGIVLWELLSRAHPFEQELGKGVFMVKLEQAVVGGKRGDRSRCCKNRYPLVRFATNHSDDNATPLCGRVESVLARFTRGKELCGFFYKIRIFLPASYE